MGDDGDSIMEYNGGCVLAMAGKNCVAIASDTRFGIKNRTISVGTFPKAFKINDTCFVGISGLATDIQTMQKELRFRYNLYKLKEEREMKPKVFASMTANLLYSHRFGPYFVEPVIAGLEDGKPFLCGLDLIGAPVYANDFVAVGTAVNSLYGVCESMWRPDLEPDDLFETVSQCLLASVDRDAMSGWGAVVHIIPGKIRVVSVIENKAIFQALQRACLASTL